MLKKIDENINNKYPAEKTDFIAFASVVSAIMVVYIHCNSCFFEFSATERYWKTANALQCVYYFAVPVFFMISGTKLIDFYERYDLKTYIKKRVCKTAIPFLFWSIIGFLYIHLYVNNGNFSEISLVNISKGLVSGRLVSIYWFFIPLFCVYICIPLFSAVNKEKKTEVFLLIISASFIIDYLIPFVLVLLKKDYSFPWKIEIGSEYIFYVLAGYLISNNELKKGFRAIIYILGVVGFLMHFLGTHILSLEAGMIVQTYKGYLNIPCLLYSVAMFVFLKYLWKYLSKRKKIVKAVAIMVNYTFSLYLLHIYFIYTINKFGLNTHSIYYRMLVPLIVIAGSIIVAYIIRKVPAGRTVLP